MTTSASTLPMNPCPSISRSGSLTALWTSRSTTSAMSCGVQRRQFNGPCSAHRSWTTRRTGANSLYDLIRLQQDGLRDRKPERFSSLQIDDQLELGWPLDGELCRLRAPEDAIDIHGSALESIESAGAVG